MMEENKQLLQKYTREANFDNKTTTINLDNRILTKFFRSGNKPAKEITKDFNHRCLRSIMKITPTLSRVFDGAECRVSSAF